jgi:hypothetical protein
MLLLCPVSLSMVVMLLTLVVLFDRHARWSEGAVVTVFNVTAYSYPVTGMAVVPATAVQLALAIRASPGTASRFDGAAGTPTGLACTQASGPLLTEFTARTHIL